MIYFSSKSYFPTPPSSLEPQEWNANPWNHEPGPTVAVFHPAVMKPWNTMET